MSTTVTRTTAPGSTVGEGAVWDPVEHVLFYLDIGRSLAHRHDPETGHSRSWELPGQATSLALRERGGLVVAIGDEVHALDLDTGVSTSLARAGFPADVVVNDGAVDRRGRYVLGGCHTRHGDPRPVGGIYSMDPLHRTTRLADRIALSNGPCFAPDDRTFYFADSHSCVIWAFDYDLDSGELSRRRVFADPATIGGVPDGATVDTEGRLWSCVFGAGKVLVFRPDGCIDRAVDLPVSMGVSPAFGGPGLDRLFVTTIDPRYFGGPPQDGAGHVYVIDGLGARGVPEPRFAG